VKIHLELTSRCSLGCLECNRTLFHNSYKVGDLSWDVLISITENPKFDFFVLSGINGDPIFYPKLLQWLQYRNQHFPEKRIHFETAIGGKSQTWWRGFFQLLKSNDTFCVSVDGLHGVSEKYRIHSKWDHMSWVLDHSASHNTFIKIWKWIVFGFNEHQLLEAKQYANALGYKFQIAKTRTPSLGNEFLIPKHEDLSYYQEFLERSSNDKV
jgi:hypothetical protein